jgi:hypothetical protein
MLFPSFSREPLLQSYSLAGLFISRGQKGILPISYNMVHMTNLKGDLGLREYLDELIKKSQAKPGIIELMRAYGRYDEAVEQSRMYFSKRYM